MVNSETIRIEHEDRVATITFDRPPVNALDAASYHKIRQAFETTGRDPNVRAIIFTGGGTRAFIAGADIRASIDRESDTSPKDPIYDLDSGRAAREAFFSVYDCAVPVIGAINGPAIGAGLVFAAVCDVLIASENARFAVTEINVGLLGAGSFLQRMVGSYKTRKLFYTGEFATPQELYRLGAVEEVVPPDKLISTARDLARRIAEKSPIAIRLAKESLNRVEYAPLKEAYRTEQDYTARLRGFEDSSEAMRAFLEKRPPEWRWR